MPPAQPIKSAVYVSDFVEVIEIYDNGFDGYTFDNVDEKGRRQEGPPRVPTQEEDLHSC